MRTVLARILLIAAFLVIWHVASGTVVAEFLASKPGRVFNGFFQIVMDGTYFFHAFQTLRAVLYGFAIGGVAGVSLGYWLAISPFWSTAMEPIISTAYTLPRIALVPILIIWIGIGQSLAIAISAILVFFLLFYNTYYGVRDVDESLVNSIRIMGGSAWDVATRVRLPSAFVWIVAGMKVSLPQAFVGVVTAEILASNRGLGYLVSRRAGQFDMTGAFAVLLGLLVLGFLLDRAVTLLSARALVWKTVDVKGAG